APAPAPNATPSTLPAPPRAAAISREAIELRPALPSVLPPVLIPALTAAVQQLAATPLLAAPPPTRVAAPERLPAANFELEAKKTTLTPEIAVQAQPTPSPTTAPTVQPAALLPATAGAAATTSPTATPTATPAAGNPAGNTAAARASPAPAKTAIDPGLLGLVPGAPDAGPRVGQDVATPRPPRRVHRV
ncbi:hypothetical protein ACVBEH_20600, partial [Roseateles sp. GG27B]